MKPIALRSVFAACLLAALTLACPSRAFAAGPSIVGTWDCVSVVPDGSEFKFTLTVKEEGGKLVATAGTDDGSMPIANLQADGDDVTFKATVGEEDYEVKLKVTDATFEGKWTGGGDSGTLKGAKHA